MKSENTNKSQPDAIEAPKQQTKFTPQAQSNDFKPSANQ